MSVLIKWIDQLTPEQLREELKNLHTKYEERGMSMRDTGAIVRSIYAPKIKILTEAMGFAIAHLESMENYSIVCGTIHALKNALIKADI